MEEKTKSKRFRLERNRQTDWLNQIKILLEKVKQASTGQRLTKDARKECVI